MKKIFMFSAVMAVILFVGLPINTEAQTSSFLNVLPTNIIISKTELKQGEAINGLFVAVNTSNTPGSNLFYSISIIGKGSEFGRTDYTSDRFNLLPLERKTLSFSYTPPKALAGRDLLLKIQVWEETGIPQGSAKASIFINGTSTIAYTESARVLVNGRSYDPLEGVMVGSNTNAVLRVVLSPSEYNETDKIYPSGGIFKKSVFDGDKVKGIKLDEVPLVNTTTIDYTLDNTLPAGVYQGILSFNNKLGESVAPSIYFRYIIPGPMGTIHSATTEVSSVKIGDTFDLNVSITGSAGGPNMTDNIMGVGGTSINSILNVNIVNEKGTVIASASKQTNPDVEKNVVLTMTADGNGSGLSANITLKSESGSVLDERIFILSVGENSVSSFLGKETIYIAIIIVIVILLIFLAIFLYRKKRQIVPSAMIALVALLGGAYGLSSVFVEETFGQSGGAPQFVETGVDQNDYKSSFDNVIHQKSINYFASQANVDSVYLNPDPYFDAYRTSIDTRCGQSPCPDPRPHLILVDYEGFRAGWMGVPCDGPCAHATVKHWDAAISGGGLIDSADSYILRPLTPGETFRVSFNATMLYCSNWTGNLYTKVEHSPDSQIFEQTLTEDNGDGSSNTLNSEQSIVTDTFTAPSTPGTYELTIFSANYPSNGAMAGGFQYGLGHDRYATGNEYVRGWREVTVTYTVEGEGAPQGVGTGNLWCGSADGETFENPPTINLCGTGTATEATPNSDQYVWACEVDDVTSGAVGLWKLNDGSGTTASDSSGSGTSGTLTNMNPASDWFTGIEGTGLYFDGTNDFVNVPDTSSLDILTDFTLSVWIKPTAAKESDIIDTTGSECGGYALWILPNMTPEFLRQCDGGSVATGGGALSTNTWYHLVGTKSGSTGTLYKNGVQVGQDTSFANFANTGAKTIGKGQDGVFQGVIDDLRIYNRALSPSEIGALYNLQGVPSDSQDCSAARTCPVGEEICLNGCAPVGECSLECPIGQTMCSDGLCRSDCAVCNAGDCDFQINYVLNPRVVRNDTDTCALTWEVAGRTIPVVCTLNGSGSYSGDQSTPININIGTNTISCSDGTETVKAFASCNMNPIYIEY